MIQNFEEKIFSILIVDDVPKNLQVLGKSLKSENIELEFALDGLEALKWIEKKEFDLVLLDIMMPNMNGIETCKKIRKIKGYDLTPIIFLTAKSNMESVLEGFKAGAQDYVIKPFDAREIQVRVKTHLELKYHRDNQKRLNKLLEEKVEERTKHLKEAYEKLSVLDKAKSEFINIINHELRTPLNGIQGGVELLENKIGDENNLIFEIINSSTERLAKLSFISMHIAQLRAKRENIAMEDVKLEDVIQKVVTDCAELAEIKKISFDTGSGIEQVIDGDYDLILTCFQSIVENAINFSPENGKIWVETKLNQNFITVSVQDEGPGFSKKAMDNLFQLFSVGEKHINDNMGLELALANLIMQAHNGSLEVVNNEKGAKVSLVFKSS